MEMRVVVVGAGDVGKELARRLAERHQVMLLDDHEDCLTPVGEPLEPEAAVTAQECIVGITCVHGDGTSRLVVKTLFNPELNCAFVSVTGHDEGNLEACRVAREVGFDPVIAIMHDSVNSGRFHEAKITVLDRPHLLADQIERAVHHKGAIVPSGVGLGRGELVEIRLLRTSPVLHRPLKNLAPYRWRIAAIFRDDELIVPTGDTTLQIEDRVLLVGDPKILPTVTEYLRRGMPQFPQPYGANVGTLELDGPDPELRREADGLACITGAANLVHGAPGAEDTLPAASGDEEPLTCRLRNREVPRSTFALPNLRSPEFATKVSRQRAGVVVTRPLPRGLVSRMFAIPGRDAQICDRLTSPVLFARGSNPYRRILLPISESELAIASAEMAIDITRQLEASLTAINVDLPQYLSGLPEEEIHAEVTPIRRLCELYEVPLDYQHREGNPIRELVDAAKDHDLIVLARHQHRRDSYFDPDVALWLARRAPCSVIVLTVRRGS